MFFSFQGRAKSIEYFITLCEELLKVHNYHLCLGVSMALRSPPIERCSEFFSSIISKFFFVRLKDSWSLVENVVAAKLEEFNSLFSHSKNFARYRQAISSCQNPCAGL